MKAILEHNSWEDLNKYLTSLTTSDKSSLAGTIFENVSKYYLQTAPHYKSKLKNVWLLREVSKDIKIKLNLPNSDEGIDLIAKTTDNEYWAIQCKYRSSPNSILTVKGDLSTFANLAFNHCVNIKHGLVLTTANKPPVKAKYLKNIGFDNLENFLALDDNDFEGWKSIKAKVEGKNFIPQAKIPRPHQVAAIEKSINYFRNNSRGKIIMPCGTGKSLASFWIARKLNAKSIIVAVPSLSLLQQTLKVWTREFLIEGIKPNWLCVCSDATVTEELDTFVASTSEMGFKITTDKREVKDWLSKNSTELKVIFTTYHSGKVTAEGSKGFTFDFAVFDEAHKTVGHEKKLKAILINNNKIKIKKRLFMTATERLFRKKHTEYLSMDNPDIYGEIIYELSFKMAIESVPQIISDYKIITFNVEDQEAYELYKSNKFIQVRKEIDDNITAREFATAIALRKAIKELGIKNSISFHSSVQRAKNFSKQQDFISKIYDEYGKIKCFHVSGKMPSGLRAFEMRSFSKSTKSLMTNARCLTEGIDLPAIDCVVFADPKRSKIDIVQAAGRSLRLSPGKKFGYILIPISASNYSTIEEASKDDPYEEVATVVGSLSTQDKRIAEYLRSVSEGRIPSKGSPVDGLIKTNVIKKINTEEFKKAVQLKIWDKIAFINWRPYQEAKKYAHSLKLKNMKEWYKHCKSKNFPKDIPKSPSNAYKKEFESFGEFLGTGFVAFYKRQYKPYQEAKKYAQSLKLKNMKEWYEHCKSKNFPKDIPKSPDDTYKKEFESFGEFLGTGFVAVYKRKYRPYQEAKKYVQSLKLKGSKEWYKQAKSKDFPKDIPAHPYAAYKKEFEGYGEFLGTGFVASYKRKYRPYQEAKKYVQSFKLKNMKEWYKHCKSKNFPKDIPANPNVTYKKEFEGYGEFLGTGTIAPFLREYRSYQEAKKYAQSLKLKNKDMWGKHTKSKDFPKDIPKNPRGTYGKEFEGWGKYLGTGTIAPFLREYRSYQEAKKYAQSLKLKGSKEWYKQAKSKDFPKDIPANPWQVYKKEFESFGEFLGTGFVAPSLREYRSYQEAKKYAQSLKLKNMKEWVKHCKSKDFPKDIPADVYRTYKKEFKSMGEFLGTGTTANFLKEYRSYQEAKKYAQSLKLKNIKEWYEHCKSKNFPKDIPTNPWQTYKKEFESFGEFLGTGYVAGSLRKYRSYQEAKKYAQSLKLKSKKEWVEHTKSKDFPKDIPKSPWQTYKNEFESLGEFLGTGFVAFYKREYRSYQEAKKYAQSLKLKGSKEWFKHTKSKDFPKDIPIHPHHTYKKEFEGMGEFLKNKKH